MISPQIYSKKEIEKIVSDKISKELSLVYSQIQKLREQNNDLNDIIKVLSRRI